MYDKVTEVKEFEQKFLDDQAWKREILAVIRSFPKGRLFTSDEIRAEAERRALRNPSHPNKWGMALRAARTQIMKITDTDRIEFLEKLNAQKRYTGKVILRWSYTGRGWRLHEASTREIGCEEIFPSVRAAIDAKMKDKKFVGAEGDPDHDLNQPLNSGDLMRAMCGGNGPIPRK